MTSGILRTIPEYGRATGFFIDLAATFVIPTVDCYDYDCI